MITIGTVSHGTMRPEDLIPTFVAELRSHGVDGTLAELLEACDAVEDFDDCDPEGLDELTVRLFDALDAIAPEGLYFGAHPGDGSDYGFWPTDEDD